LYIDVQTYCVLSTAINKRTSHSDCNTYYLNGVLFTNSVNVLDLDITILADVSYNAHINNLLITLSLERYSDRVLTSFRGFISHNLQLMRKSSVNYIRPILEYKGILWIPNLVYLFDLIESVQPIFTKRIISLESVPYSNRRIYVVLLYLQPLELRRPHLDLINYYKIINGLSSFTATF